MGLRIYLAGPIDFASSDPDARHTELTAALFAAGLPADIYCPTCDQRKTPLDPVDRIGRNEARLLDADWAIFVWNPRAEPSVGTPIEIWCRLTSTGYARPSVLVSPARGATGLFMEYFGRRGLFLSTDIAAAVRRIVASSRRMDTAGVK